MSAGRKEGWEEKKKKGRAEGKERGKSEGEGRRNGEKEREEEREGGGRRRERGRDKCNTALAAASRSNHWLLSELPLNEGLSYHVFALLLYT